MGHLVPQVLAMAQVKEYAEEQWLKILSGRVSLADFVFAKEVRLGTYSGKGPAPPAAIVAAKAMAQDPRAEPRFSEGVPYIVVHGAPGQSAHFCLLVQSMHMLMPEVRLQLEVLRNDDEVKIVERQNWLEK